MFHHVPVNTDLKGSILSHLVKQNNPHGHQTKKDLISYKCKKSRLSCHFIKAIMEHNFQKPWKIKHKIRILYLAKQLRNCFSTGKTILKARF